MKPPKFNFVPERLLGKQEQNITAFTASLYANGQLVLKSEYVRIYELDNKYIKVFGDIEKRAIGWQVIEGKTTMEEVDDSRLLKRDVNGAAKISVGRILSKLGIKDLKESLRDLEIKTYKSALNAGDIYYVIIPPLEIKPNESTG